MVGMENRTQDSGGYGYFGVSGPLEKHSKEKLIEGTNQLDSTKSVKSISFFSRFVQHATYNTCFINFSENLPQRRTNDLDSLGANLQKIFSKCWFMLQGAKSTCSINYCGVVYAV